MPNKYTCLVIIYFKRLMQVSLLTEMLVYWVLETVIRTRHKQVGIKLKKLEKRRARTTYLALLSALSVKSWVSKSLSKGQVALEDKTVYLCQKSVITMKNQVRPVCSPKDKICSQTDKLQRCRRLPLEQAKLRQILDNNREGVLIRKWFDRWYVAESLSGQMQ